jgi:hypothetical protein
METTMSSSDKSSQDTSAFAGFGKFVPGFDFLQNLATQAAGTAAERIPQLPNLGNWVAPTLNVEELDKRIGELKSVQFWLDQNATALKATIQALEVQKMTLATLKGMNFNMGDVANAFKLKVADTMSGGMQGMADKAKTFAGLEVPPRNPPVTAKPEDKTASAATTPVGIVDPMQWWGALTQQFQTIAADAMKDAAKKTAIDTAKSMTTGLAKDAMKSASGMARDMATSATKTVADSAKAAMNSALRSTQAWPVPVSTASRRPAKAAPKRAAAKTAKPAARAKPARKAAK